MTNNSKNNHQTDREMKNSIPVPVPTKQKMSLTSTSLAEATSPRRSKIKFSDTNTICTKGVCSKTSAQVAHSSISSFEDYQVFPRGPPSCLIKYKTPVVVGVKNKRGQFVPFHSTDRRVPISFGAVGNIFQESATHCILKLTGNNEGVDSVLNEGELINLLNNIYPPILWRRRNHAYLQKVSHEKTNPKEVQKLVKELSKILEKDESTWFTVDDRIFGKLLEAFDECIRQIILVCPIRGILFRRIRDHIQADIGNLQSLYISAAAFAARKDLNLHTHLKLRRKELREVAKKKEAVQEKIRMIKKDMEELLHQHEIDKEFDAIEFRRLLAELKNEKRKVIAKLKTLGDPDGANKDKTPKAN